jgi:L-malate glycosyltransferase
VHAMNSRYFFMAADRMVACSNGVRQHIINQGVDPSKILTIYNGIDSRRFNGLNDPSETRNSLGLSTTDKSLVCIAHLADKKGQSSLVRAMAILSDKWPDLYCFLAGIGENRETLISLAEELGVSQRVRLLGYRNDAVSLMNAADVVMLPSLCKEGLPLVLLEAALLGKPAICSNIPGNNEVVLDGETGLLFPPGDAESLATQIDLLVSDQKLRSKMGLAARSRAQGLFTIEAMTDRMVDLYRDVADKKRKIK